MYKRIDLSNNQMRIEEHFGRPTVYLDHWALNDLSQNTQFRKRFIESMNDRGGTLRLSVYNIVELINQSDGAQRDSILEMIDLIDCGFISIDPREVITRENVLNNDPLARFNPSIEMDLVVVHLRSKNYPMKWRVSDIILAALSEASSTGPRLRGHSFTEGMRSLVTMARSDPHYLKKSAERFHRIKTKGQRYQAATRELFQMAIDFVVRNQNMKMSRYADWGDLFHVIVPVAYCDMVLLDRRWKTFISQTGLSFPGIAKVFDKRSIDDFFRELEGWQIGSKPTLSKTKARLVTNQTRRRAVMKNLKKDLQAVTRELKALTRKTESLAKKVAKLEKAQAVGPPRMTAKVVGPPRMTAKVVGKAPAKKKGAPTATDQVVNIIKRSKKGVDAPTLMKKTGLADKTVRNILFRAGKQRKIKKAGRGVYVGA